MKDLFPHNQKAAEAVMESFKTQQRECVVHATGTGKSYIIAAVAENYKKVLVIAPSDFILDETRKLIGERAEYLTYTYLMVHKDEPQLEGYDFICLDEFHRAGAELWGEAVSNLLDVNKQAKVLGTTATEIRYLDGSRDMAHEIFHDNVVSRLNIVDAWVQGILTPPKYITGMFTFDRLSEDFIERVDNSTRLSEERKAELKTYMEGERLD